MAGEISAALTSHPRHIGAVTLVTRPLPLPTDTLVVAFRMPAAPDPVAPALAWLRHIPILGGRLPPPPQRYARVLRGFTRDGTLLGG